MSISNLLAGLAIFGLAVVVLWGLAVVVILLAGAREHTDDAPDPVDEHFKSAPRVIAGEDLDKDKRAIVTLALDAMLAADPALAALNDLDLSAYYVTPEGER